MGDILRRRAMMVQAAAPVAEPNVTIADITGNGTNSIAVDLGMSSPSILTFYAKAPLGSGTFWNNDGGYRLMQLADADYARDLIDNTTTTTNNGGSLGTAASAVLVYQNGVLSYNSSIVLRNSYEYRVIAINPSGRQAKKLAIATFTGNGQGSISVDLGDIDPSILLLYPTTPMTSGAFPSQNNGQRLFMLMDTSVQQAGFYYANTRSSTSNGNILRTATSSTAFGYSNGVLSVGSSVVLRNNYTYKVIAIE